MKNKLLHTSIIFSLLLVFSNCFAQAPVNYDDVGVIVSINNTNSVAIAKYFAKKRNIPAKNIIRYDDVDLDNISGADFRRIAKSIEDTIKAHGLTGKLNYLVTSLGVPYNVTRLPGPGQCDLNSIKYWNNKSIMQDSCASFDSEIMLIGGSLKNRIGKADALFVPTVGDTQPKTHPFFNEPDQHFTYNKFGYYLVTRLTGFDTTEVFKLIDRSGPYQYVDKSSVKIIFDDFYSNVSFPTANYLAGEMRVARDTLKKRGWNITLDSSSTFIDSQSNVFGYVGWGTNDPVGKLQKGIPYNKYVTGAISNNYYSYSGKNQNNTKNAYSLSTEQLYEGANGSFGNTLEPFSFGMSIASYLYNKYTDPRPVVRYNLAESYWNSVAEVSWFGVVAGDPKSSIVTTPPALPSPAVDTITVLVKGNTRLVKSSNNSQGYMHWFKTDSATLKASGQPLDSTNKYWVNSGANINVKDTMLGTYKYTYMNQNYVGKAFRQITFKVVKLTGVDENHSTVFVKIFPNPNNGQFNLQLQNNLPQNVNVEIKDVSGKTIFTRSFVNAVTINENIKLENAAKGIYFISIINGAEKSVHTMEVK